MMENVEIWSTVLASVHNSAKKKCYRINWANRARTSKITMAIGN